MVGPPDSASSSGSSLCPLSTSHNSTRNSQPHARTKGLLLPNEARRHFEREKRGELPPPTPQKNSKTPNHFLPVHCSKPAMIPQHVLVQYSTVFKILLTSCFAIFLDSVRASDTIRRRVAHQVLSLVRCVRTTRA